MSVSIQVGSTSSATNVIDKSAVLRGAVPATLKQPCSMENPVFLVNSSQVGFSDNYLYCGNFNRYYYITDIVPQTGGMKAIVCSVDPLKSFASEIKALTVNVAREEGADFSDIGDPNVTTLERDTVIVKNFSGGLTHSSGTYLLAITS